MAFADEALAGLAHRRVTSIRRRRRALRAGFEAKGWKAVAPAVDAPRDPAAARAGIAVEEVPYDAVHDCASPGTGGSPARTARRYLAQAREVALRRERRVLAVREAGAPVAFAQLERDGAAAEITQVYVRPDHRGGGRGTAMTRAAIEAAGDVRDLWIVADDEDRPKELYARLGFRPAWTTMEFTRWPRSCDAVAMSGDTYLPFRVKGEAASSRADATIASTP